MPIVELQNIRKVYDAKVAVEGLSLTIEPGSVYSDRTALARPAPSA
jgi:ABC-2 type transport system ATP-binding protein